MAAQPEWNVVLRALREARGATQEGWAARLGYSRRTLVRWEQGDAVPDAAAEAAIVALCQEERLLRSYDRGPLARQQVSAAWLADLLTAARSALPLPEPRALHLPAPLTSFIGREHELAVVTALLATTRLLVLTGPGGSGKTRVALAAARHVRRRFHDGVWFVDLSGVADPAGVVPAIAHVIGVIEPPGHPLAQALAAKLRNKCVLLVLDNFEQVADAALLLLDLLAEARQLALLVTSRTALHVEGEHEYTVPPLPLPAQTGDPEPERLGQNPAVRLFVERARSLQSDFALTAENATTVGEICRRLDGLPLAIELAAARIRLLPPTALLARLDHRLALLAGGVRSLPARQQTLRATIAWSWDLLPVVEQVLLRRLAVFAGGWTLDAASAVCDIEGTLDVLAGMAALVDKNLAEQTERDGEPRFTMLATVREFALEQLIAAGEADLIRRRHAEHFCALAEAADADYWSTGRVRADLRTPLDRERDNLLAALQWALDEACAEVGVRLAGALGYWFFVQAPSEGYRWLRRALALPGATQATKAYGLVLLNAASCGAVVEEPRVVVATYEEAATVFRGSGEPAFESAARALRSAYLPPAAADDALEDAEAALTLARRSGNPYITAYVSLWAGLARLVRRGDVAAARAHYEETLQLARDLGADFLTAMAMRGLGEVARRQDQKAEARQLWQEARPLLEAVGNQFNVAFTCIDLALIAANDHAAAAEWRRALSLAGELESVELTAICVAGVAGLLTAGGKTETAARLLAVSERADRDGAVTARYRPQFLLAYEPALAATQAALDPDQLARARVTGQSLSLHDAIDLALAELAPAASAAGV